MPIITGIPTVAFSWRVYVVVLPRLHGNCGEGWPDAEAVDAFPERSVSVVCHYYNIDTEHVINSVFLSP